MEPDIVELAPIPLIGTHTETSLSENIAPALWKDFKQRIMPHVLTTNPAFYSVQQFPAADFASFNRNTLFRKWAAIASSDVRVVPDNMHAMTLRGLYALFIHRGPHNTFSRTTHYIYNEWLPPSAFQLDHRPHFEKMDHRYLGPLDANSEEEIWIPVMRRSHS